MYNVVIQRIIKVNLNNDYYLNIVNDDCFGENLEKIKLKGCPRG